MFIPLNMVLIGIDPYPNGTFSANHGADEDRLQRGSDRLKTPGRFEGSPQ